MDSHELKPLPFFPVPYPGESLYSVLCRYHVRSGNVSAYKSIRQLFGDYASLASTLLLPPMLNRFEYWTTTDMGFDAKHLLREHTAFSLCKLRAYSKYQSVFSGTNSSAVFSKQLRRGTFRQHMIQHPSQMLRYCPVCAAEQKKVYGESYWQILPQLDGVEYCPFHKTKILSSAVNILQIQHSFYPADSVLHQYDPDFSISECLWYNKFHIEEYSELFITMAKTISYLWKNLPYFSGIWFLLERYRIAFSQKNSFWQSAESVRNKLLERNTLPLVNWALCNSTGSIERRFLFFNNFSLSEHAMIISLLSPSPEEFFRATAL